MDNAYDHTLLPEKKGVKEKDVLPFEWFIALRYLREGRMQTILILAGVSMGVGVIIFLSALIAGLQTSLIQKTLGTQAHVIVRPLREEARPSPESPGTTVVARQEIVQNRLRSINQWQQVADTMSRIPGIIAVTPSVSGSALVSHGNANKPVSLKGVEPESFNQVINLASKITAGTFRITSTEVVIGKELAAALGTLVGDKLRITTQDHRSEIFTVSGIFDAGSKDLNERWVLVSLHTAQSLFGLVGGVSSLEATVEEIFAADDIAKQVAEQTGLLVDNWTKINAQLMAGLRSQNWSQYMVQFFVIFTVALGIASMLVVAVVQKSREIGVMKAVGTSTSRVMRIFLIQGGIVGLVGSSLGSILGAGLSLTFAGLAINPDGSPTFPVDLSPYLFLTASLIATTTGLIAAAIPAHQAARLDPAAVIRYG